MFTVVKHLWSQKLSPFLLLFEPISLLIPCYELLESSRGFSSDRFCARYSCSDYGIQIKNLIFVDCMYYYGSIPGNLGLSKISQLKIPF